MIKLIVFDLDDTLAKLGKGIVQADLIKLKTLEQRGIIVAICSGKPTYYLCGFMRQVELDNPVLVGENGAVIQIGVDLPPKEFYIQEYSLAAQRSMNLLREKITEAIPAIWYQPNMVGLTPFPANTKEHQIIQDILDTYNSELKDIVVYHHVDSYDITPVGINKKSGMQLLSSILNIVPNEIVAVGNGENDYPMFSYAGLAIGINVPDISKVNQSFKTSSEALDFLLEYVTGQQ